MQQQFHQKQLHSLAVSALVFFLFAATAAAQFNSGSDGSDGALNLTTPGTIVFDPAALGLDVDGDGVYHFTTINVAAGVTVRLGGDILGSAPVIWLASGDVTIGGTLDLDGGDGYDAGQIAQASIPGAGGYRGGLGTSPSNSATNGSGPGGATIGISGVIKNGSGAGHRAEGEDSGNASASMAGPAYGNEFLMPLLGGSGGSGGGFAAPSSVLGAGGGAGGGAIQIASSGTITINGDIHADGGDGGDDATSTQEGGGGSGGAIRLMANILDGAGSLSVAGGSAVSGAGPGAPGRIRLEALSNTFAGTTDPGTVTSSPGLVFPPPTAPRVRVTRIDGVDLPANPRGGVAPADAVIDASGAVTIEIEANYIPLGTVVELAFVSEGNQRVVVNSTPLAGALDLSTATASATIPHGFAIFNVQASWAP